MEYKRITIDVGTPLRPRARPQRRPKELAASGEIPSVKINGKLNFPKSDLQEWVDQQIEHDVSRANAGKLLAESAMRKENRGTNL